MSPQPEHTGLPAITVFALSANSLIKGSTFISASFTSLSSSYSSSTYFTHSFYQLLPELFILRKKFFYPFFQLFFLALGEIPRGVFAVSPSQAVPFYRQPPLGGNQEKLVVLRESALYFGRGYRAVHYSALEFVYVAVIGLSEPLHPVINSRIGHIQPGCYVSYSDAIFVHFHGCFIPFRIKFPALSDGKRLMTLTWQTG